MARAARVPGFAAVAWLACGLLCGMPQARAGDAFVLRPSRALTATLAGGSVCDIFANGYDDPAATACAGCFDKQRDFNESDVDCGGSDCNRCATGLQCTIGSDCLSGKCSGGVCVDSLLISQVQTRGSNQGNDEFVELYNPSDAPVTFDASWALQARSAVGTCTSTTASVRFNGSGQTVAPHGYLLYVNSAGYDGPTSGDAAYTSGITDAASLVLQHGASVADALCFYYDVATETNLVSCAVAYVCEGTPVQNPHDNTINTNSDASLERKPGGALGSAQDTGDNAADFSVNTVPDPHNQASDPAPVADPGGGQ